MPGTLKNRILIVGPSPGSSAVGGVVNHVRTLKSFSVFQSAEVFDPGSMNGSLTPSAGGNILKRILALRSYVRMESPDTVIINVSIYGSSIVKMLLILLALPAGAGRPVIRVFFHGGRFLTLPSAVRAGLVFPGHRLLRRPVRFHFLSRVQRDEFTLLFPDLPAGMYMNYSAYDDVLEPAHGTASGPLRLLFVGRVVREKGVFEFLDALARIHRQLPGAVHGTIVGDGPALEQVRERVTGDLHDIVKVTGPLRGVALEEQYRAAHVLVLPSYAEGFPYTVIEAFRAGLPVIASSTGALPDIIKAGETGLLIAPASVQQLVDAIMHLHTGRDGLARMSALCHRQFLDAHCRRAGERYYEHLIMQGASS